MKKLITKKNRILYNLEQQITEKDIIGNLRRTVEIIMGVNNVRFNKTYISQDMKDIILEFDTPILEKDTELIIKYRRKISTIDGRQIPWDCIYQTELKEIE